MPVAGRLSLWLLLLLSAAFVESASHRKPPASCSAPLVSNRCFPDAPDLRAYNSSDASDCCAACMLERECNAFVVDDIANICHLKIFVVEALARNGSCRSGALAGIPIQRPPLPTPAPAPKDAKNVLFITVDDMRPMTRAGYNFSLVQTPAMDNMAAEGVTFDFAYVQYSYCSPSRNSFMSGRRPDTNFVWNFNNHFREPDVGLMWATLPQYFKQHGYLTLGGGKLFHPQYPPFNDAPWSWSEGYPYFLNQPPNLPHTCVEKFPEDNPTYCIADVDKDATILTDQQIRDNCIEHLRIAANHSEQPFFVGCGLHKPHVPWIVPKEFYDMLPPAEEIPLAEDTYVPVNMPPMAWHFPSDVHGFNISFNGTCNATISRLYRRAYYAAVAYQDYNIGKVLAALEELGFYNTTVVSVNGDHGWQLGEHDIWSKMTNFELGTHIPWFVRAPWKRHSAGSHAKTMAEAVDIYPTLVDLAGLPDPKSKGEAINGTSLAAVFDNPATIVKAEAYSQFAKKSNFDVNAHFLRNQTKIMGYTIRVPDWRYTCWFKFNGDAVQVEKNKVLGRELYTHAGDTGRWLDFPGENRNLINDARYADVVRQLHQKVLDYIQL